MVRPVRPPHKVTSGYGPRVLNGSSQLHNGIDYINTEGDCTVLAMAPGTVIFDKDNYNPALRWTVPAEGGGNYVIIRSLVAGIEYFIRYLHLGGNLVSVGQYVDEGAKIGTYADAGYSFGPHTHIDFWTLNWTNIDPTQIILSNLNK